MLWIIENCWKKTVLITCNQSPRSRLQCVSFVQPTVQNPKTLCKIDSMLSSICSQLTSDSLNSSGGWNIWATEPASLSLWAALTSRLVHIIQRPRSCREQQYCRNIVISGCCDLFLSTPQWPRSPQILSSNSPSCVPVQLLLPLLYLSVLQELLSALLHLCFLVYLFCFCGFCPVWCSVVAVNIGKHHVGLRDGTWG